MTQSIRFSMTWRPLTNRIRKPEKQTRRKAHKKSIIKVKKKEKREGPHTPTQKVNTKRSINIHLDHKSFEMWPITEGREVWLSLLSQTKSPSASQPASPSYPRHHTRTGWLREEHKKESVRKIHVAFSS
ncbi:hypothetical protein E2C01_043842 [Portunus trituberculatus]|uniref:Uncharacterized protein n=1 Tax=Portunus trituberculatus TaxID=210409 RepID=A0A5B7FYE1_PORTR|nr:hypothetical protein [Portunus trituberculatus]